MLAACAGAVWLPTACLCVDEQPRALAPDAGCRGGIVALDAYVLAELRRAVQWPLWSDGNTVGGALQGLLGGLGSYFLACSRYIELNPVRAWMVARPADFPWSSYGAHAGEREDPLLVAHPEYLALGVDSASREAGYRALFQEALLLSWWWRSVATFSNRRRWARIDSARGSRRGPVVSPLSGRSVGRRAATLSLTPFCWL